MQIDTRAAVQLMIEAAGPPPAVQVEASMAVQKQVLDTVENVAQTLLAGLDPTRGQHVDLRV